MFFKQKCAFSIILGKQYLNYKQAMTTLGCDSLNDRRIKLCQSFAKKAGKHLKYKNWFSEFGHERKKCSKRQNEKKTNPMFNPVPTRTDRYKKSPLPYLTELLNNI